MLITVLSFLVTLGVLVVVHEWGHYRVAVACGVKVLRFSVGFGRVLWRHQRDREATEFVICALPLGGYVRMLDEREGHVQPYELDRAFNRKPLPARAAIVSAGPLANLALAVLLYAAAHMLGIVEPKAVLSAPPPASLMAAAGLDGGDWVRSWSRDGQEWQDVQSMTDLRWQITQAALAGEDLQLMVSDRDGRGNRNVQLPLSKLGVHDLDAQALKAIGLTPAFSEPVLGEIKPGGPAAAAGLRRGDRVLSIDGRDLRDAYSVREAIMQGVRDGRAREQHWRLERDGQVLELPVRPRVHEDGERQIGRIDAYVGGPAEVVTVRQGPVDALVLGARRTWEVSALTLRMLGRMVVAQASLRNLSGPLTIADVAGQSVQQGLAYYLSFLALVSVSLGVLNLLPLPMLDGGHLMYYAFEAVTGRPVSELWLARLQRGGIALLLMMMSVALYNDLARLLGLH
ncbi:MAG TPA: RIP metalloprotease RseP [Rubrivivax sp.]|nr:RIP metalloprotease RseP [Burkholderiales bacterium]HNU12405.1 RIP metalloprotease RseP [Rubrivivax sp.]